MGFRPLAVLIALVLADWGLWTWSIGSDHGTVSLVAGLLMAPLFVGLAWLATLTLTGGVRVAADRVRRRGATLPQPPAQLPRRPPVPDSDRLAA
ncbi:MAG: hypothetical protein NVSMB51_22130 [Solirubrobacteraceae bacterium]